MAAHDTASMGVSTVTSPSGLFISLMASLAALPLFLFALPAGVRADAFNEGKILRLANLWLAACAGVLALLGAANLLNPPLLLAGVFLLGVGFAVNAPAWASLVPQIVTDEQLPSATTLSGVQLYVSSILGPALAGLLVSRLGAPWVFGLNAAGFLLVFAAVPALPKTGLGWKQTVTGFSRSLLDAGGQVRRSKGVRRILLQNAVFSALIAAVPALAPVLLLKELHLDSSSLGLVFASMGVGSVVSALLILPRLRSRFDSDRLLLMAQLTLAAIYLWMVMVPHCLYCLIPMALAGASWTLAASELWVAAQRAISNGVRGRLSALLMVLSQGAMAAGGIGWGLSAATAGTRFTLTVAAVLFAFAAGLGRLFRSPREPLALQGETLDLVEP